MSPLALLLRVERPAALWALVLPLLFLLLLRLFERAPRHVTGTLELWKELAPSAPRGATRRGPLPSWALLCALGLLCGAVAGIGPRAPRAAAPRAWTCVVDLSPSMGLPREAGGPTRLEVALAAAQVWLEAEMARGERVRWLSPGRAPLVLARGERPPPAWLDPEADGSGEPDWALHDAPGTLWITDRAPVAARRQAGLFASGGAEVEGPIAADGRTTIRWQEGALRAEASAAGLAVQVREPEGQRLPAPLERVLAAWCEARGLDLVRGSRVGTLLVVELRVGEPRIELALARDGWRATGRGAALAAEASEGSEDWLLGREAGGRSLPVVRARTGALRVGLAEMSEPEGDPALFALSWARLLDGVLRRPPGVVPLAERLAAGAPRIEPGVPALPGAGAGTDLGPYLDAGFALAAALCTALAALRFARG